MRKEDILARLPPDARNQIAITEQPNCWLLEHPYITDEELFFAVKKAIAALGGDTGHYYSGLMHYEIPKVKSGVAPHVLTEDKSKPPELGIDSEAPYKEVGNAIPSEPYDLRKSVEKLGQLCPVLLDKDGHVIDGLHRMELDPKWPTIKLDNIDTPVKRGLARIASNFCRRTVDAEELTREITMLIGYGLKPKQISELTGISERTIYRHMPEHLKDKTYVELGKIPKKTPLTRVSESEVVREEPTPRFVECEACHLGTSDPQTWHSHTLCPTCKIKADLNPEPYDRKFKRGRLPPEPKAKEIKPKAIEAWKDREARMHPQHSKMERTQRIRLSNAGKTPETDREFCVLSTTPDFVFPNVFIYLDHEETHKNRKDRDDWLRELLAKREGKRVVSIEYESNSQQEEDRVFNEIMEALEQ